LDPLIGGYALSMNLSLNDYPMGAYSSLLFGTMFGSALVYNSPVGIAVIRAQNLTLVPLSAAAVFQNDGNCCDINCYWKFQYMPSHFRP
jgi:ethanolamine transporter EutH